MQPIITLTTDFGLSDHYVAAMKGIILGIAPNARTVDISHQVEAYEIAEAAYLMAQAYTCFPKKTIHVVVVDPGVGSARRPILAQAAGQYFVAPDNGVLGMVFAREKHAVRHITAERFWRRPVSQTFHGRDIFAPVAAHLAKGVPWVRFGKTIQDHLRPKFGAPEQTGKHAWTGVILKIDHFGNVITNFRLEDFAGLGTRPFELQAGPHAITRFVHNYAQCAQGELVAITGSAGYVEISTNQGSAAKLLGCGSGAPVELRIF